MNILKNRASLIFEYEVRMRRANTIVSSDHSPLLASWANLGLKLVMTDLTHGMTAVALHNLCFMGHVLKANGTFWVKELLLLSGSLLAFFILLEQSLEGIFKTLKSLLQILQFVGHVVVYSIHIST